MILAAVAALIGASVQSATGFGFALVLSPALVAVLRPEEAVAVALALGLLLNVLVLAREGPKEVRWLALAPALAAAIPGLALGVAIIANVSKPLLQVIVGALVLVAVAVQARRPPVAAPGSVAEACAAGLASGVLTTSTSLSGPPLVLWLERRGLGPRAMRASLAACFLALNLAGAVALLVAGAVGRVSHVSLLGLLLVLTFAGHLAGARAGRRLSGPRFRAVVLGLVAITGAASLGAGLASL